MRSPLAVLAAVLPFVAAPALAWEVRMDSEGDVVKWTRPLKLVLDAQAAIQLGEPKLFSAVEAAVKHLDNATPYLDVSVTEGAAGQLGYRMDGSINTNAILVLEDWPYDDESALAVTLVTLNAHTNEILDADIAINGSAGHRFRVLGGSVRRDVDSNADDVQNMITHELGHVLGLMHSEQEEDLVMYPSAPPGEIAKRALKEDDREGLLALYGAPPETPGVQPLGMGCSSTGTPSTGPLAMVILGMLLLRRLSSSQTRRLAVVAAAVMPWLARAAESDVPASLTTADDVLWVQVAARDAHLHPSNPGLIVTTLRFSTPRCLRGTCGDLVSVEVPGGRVGELEQVVVHAPVPELGNELVLVRTHGRVKVIRVETESLRAALRALAGSTQPQESNSPHSASLQVPAMTP